MKAGILVPDILQRKNRDVLIDVTELFESHFVSEEYGKPYGLEMVLFGFRNLLSLLSQNPLPPFLDFRTLHIVIKAGVLDEEPIWGDFHDAVHNGVEEFEVV